MEMVKTKLIFTFAVFLTISASAQNFKFEWSTPVMDGSRAANTIPMLDNVDEAIGVIDGKTYIAPNGRKYKKGSTPAVAGLMIEAQPIMAPVKEYIGYTTHFLSRRGPELTNMIVDSIMEMAEKETGEHIDVGLLNYGGVRFDLAEGNILRDDIVSMLPFKNYIAVLDMKGSELKRFFDDMAKNRMQVLGGVTVTVKDGQVLELSVGGRPVDNDATYHFVTADFLLNGGDNIFAKNYASKINQTDIILSDAFLAYLKELRDEGKPIEYDATARVTDLTEIRR